MLLLVFVIAGALAAPHPLFSGGDQSSDHVIDHVAENFTDHARCPSDSSIYPCTCTVEDTKAVRLHCHDIHDVTQLQQAFNIVKDYQITTLTIIESSMEKMMGHIFFPMAIHVLQLSRVNFSKLTFLPEIQTVDTKLLGSLNTITIEKAHDVDQWDWSGLQEFKKLDQIEIRESSFTRLTKSFGNLPLTMKRIVIEHVDMKTIAYGALAKLENLSHLQIQHTPLETFERCYLPKPAKDLMKLDLAYNQLTTLPLNLFEEMPRLSVVYLKGNKFATLSQYLFDKLNFNQRFFLALSGNPFNCDCNLKWLNRLIKQRREIFGSELDLICSEPYNLRHEHVGALDEEDFQCRKIYWQDVILSNNRAVIVDIELENLTQPTLNETSQLNKKQTTTSNFEESTPTSWEETTETAVDFEDTTPTI